MKILILGWYGTETIGDRAILAGIIRLYTELNVGKIDLVLGSIYPPLTDRTVFEDREFWGRISEDKINSVHVFYSFDTAKLDLAISQSDDVIIGGGPLIDNGAMYMFRYAFKKARKKGVRTIILGCGWETVYLPEFQKCGGDIIELSDIAIFRDSTSADRAMKHVSKDIQRPIGLVDPAFFAAQFFRKLQANSDRKEDLITINLRHQFVSKKRSKDTFALSDCASVVEKLALLYEDHPVILVPMHTFAIGGDDRVLLNDVAFRVNKTNVAVQNVPLSLAETLEMFYNSKCCLGMRFHSVVLQTVLNGRNYIMDYTDSKTGKIINMLNQLNLRDSFSDRYIHYSDISNICIKKNLDVVNVSDSLIDKYKEQYLQKLK